jgi:hypothetical protein
MMSWRVIRAQAVIEPDGRTDTLTLFANFAIGKFKNRKPYFEKTKPPTANKFGKERAKTWVKKESTRF